MIFVGDPEFKAWMLFNAVSRAEKVTKKTRKKTIEYFNCPCSFDIETSSWMNNGVEEATMYLWAVDLNGALFYGRTWQQFLTLCDMLTKVLNLSVDKRIVIYVHNLAYEFQWMQRLFKWDSVFAREPRKPMKAVTTSGIEFRCSYVLSGYSLAKVADNLTSHTIEKLVGDLDYNLIRTSETEITPEEMGYMRNDVLIVEYFISEEMTRNGDITKIPLTATGYVRRTLRDRAFPKGVNPKMTKYYNKMQMLKIKSADEYHALMRAFAGGFTHASPLHVGNVLNNVSSIDFNSSYPAVLVNYKYPMGSAVYRESPSAEWVENAFADYCCIADFEFINIRPRVLWDNPISFSKCWKTSNASCNNGRVHSADLLCITATNVDYEVWEKFYEWDAVKIYNVYRYYKSYLPREFIETVRDLYKFKTTLKGVPGKEAEYMHSKGQLNSMYGCCVTSIISPEVEFNGEWKSEPPDIDEKLKEYNETQTRTLFYPWGVFVTAYARRNLFYGILEFKSDYIYADTDSIKCLNYEKHREYVDRYNRQCIELSKECCRHFGFPDDTFSPKTSKGVPKPLGIWDYEGEYSQFKCLGAKRYLVEKEGKYTLTVAGLNKKTATPYMEQHGNIFDFFDDEMYIPPEYSGKLIHTYIDAPQHGVVTDYTGKQSEWYEETSCHLRPGHYSLQIAKDYKEFLEKMKLGIDKYKLVEYI